MHPVQVIKDIVNQAKRDVVAFKPRQEYPDQMTVRVHVMGVGIFEFWVPVGKSLKEKLRTMQYVFEELGAEPAYCESHKEFDDIEGGEVRTMICGSATVSVKFRF